MNKRVAIVLFICLAWNFAFFWAISVFSLNIPFFDDFDSLGEFILQIQSATFFQKIALLFGQYAEHRIAYTRLSAWIAYVLTDQLPFNSLVFFGMLGLLGIQVLFFLLLRRLGKSFFWFLPIPFLLLNFQYWENLVSAMTALQNLNAPLFALLFCYIVACHGFRFWAYVVALLAIFTSGNGLLLLPLGFLFGFVSKQPLKQMGYWALFSLVAILVYFSTYQTPPAVFGGRTPLLYSIQHVDLFLDNLSLFLSSTFEAFSFETYFINYFAMGFLLSFGIIFSLRDFFLAETRTPMQYFILLAFAYILGTAILVALNRGSEPSHMFFSRYRIYSSLFFCLIYIAYLYLLPLHSQLIFVFITFYSLRFFVFSFPYLSHVLAHSDEMKYGAKTYHLNKKQWIGLYPPYTSYFSNATSISRVSQALARNEIYDVPYLDTVIPQFSKMDTLEMSKQEMENYTQFRNENLVLNWQGDQFALLVSANHKVFVPLKTQWNAKDLVKKIMGSPTLIRGFEVHVSKHNLNHGDYDVYVFPNGKPAFVSMVHIPRVSNANYHN
jgi:hypothetical protein